MTEPDGRTVTHTYDNNDNLLTQTVSNGVSYRYTYDVRNRATGLTATLDGWNFVFGYGYDVYGRMTSLSYPNRTSPVTYSYDGLDRLQSIPGFVTGCSYDLDNKLTRMTYANGVANTYSYDANDRPTTIAAGSLLNLSYGYDPAGNITRINSDYYGYDGLNRLTWYGSSATPGSGTGTRWSYDGAGNMSNKTKYLNSASQGVTSFGYDLANRLWSMGSTTYANDAFGARTGKAAGDSWTYSYDGESRLTRVAKNGATQVDCVYDGNGMRVKKVENGKTTYYIYSGANPLLEYSPTDGTYLYRIYAGKKAVAEEKGGVVKFYHKDHLGSTRVVTNAAGVKIAEYKFAPYGEKEVSTGDGTEYGFTDKADDASTGLKYFGARFYDAEVGRFISQDPKRQGGNWYSYCFNNPVNATDPDGQWADTLIDATSLAADVKDIIDNPRDPVAWMCLVTDVLCTVTPGVTGGRVTVKGIELALSRGTRTATWVDKAADAIRAGEKLNNSMKSALRSEARSIMGKSNKAYANAVKAGQKVDVHHVIPLEYAHLMGPDFNPNALSNLTAYDKSVHTQINKDWAEFKNALDGKEPTEKQVEDFANYISETYADNVIE